MYQFKNLSFYFLIIIIYKLTKINCNHIRRSDDIFQYPFLNNYLSYEKGQIFKSIKNLQDSVAQVNSNLFYNVFNKNNHQFSNDNLINKRRTDLSNSNKPSSDYAKLTISSFKPITDYRSLTNYYKQFTEYKPISDYYKPITDYYKSDYKNILTNYKPLFKRNDKQLHLIQQLNKEIVRNQLVAYEKFLNKLKRYDTSDQGGQVESRQAVNIIKTLFRFPVLLLFSNLFNLPLLPTLVLASPFLNDGSSNNALNSLTSTLSNVASNVVSNPSSSSAAPASSATSNLFNSAANLQTSASNQISSHLPFSLNPLVPINQLLNNFISELIGELQNTPVFNGFLQSVNQILVKPNRVSPLQNQQSNSQNVAQNITKKLINEQIAALNSTADDLINANASSINLVYQEPPPSTPLAYDKPLIGPVPDANPSGNILNTLASSLLETNKNYQLTEQLGVNNGGSISELAMNAVNTLATMLKIKKQKKDLNSNEEMILDMLTSKNYLQEVTSIGNLLKFGLKQKMEKEMNACLVRTICESNQKQIAFAFDQLFSLAMHLTGMESRIEHSPWNTYYRVGRKMINEKNICKLIPKCRDDDEDEDKDPTKMKLNLLEKIEKAKKLNNLLSRKESNQPDFQKPFRIIRKARKLRFAKRLFNKSFKKFNRLSRRMSRMLF